MQPTKINCLAESTINAISGNFGSGPNKINYWAFSTGTLPQHLDPNHYIKDQKQKSVMGELCDIMNNYKLVQILWPRP